MMIFRVYCGETNVKLGFVYAANATEALEAAFRKWSTNVYVR